MTTDNSVYGLSRRDAKEVVSSLGGKEKTSPSTRTGGLALFSARLKEPWASGVAECDIFAKDGLSKTDTGEDALVYDADGIFSSLTTDNFVDVLKQSGKYYAIQAGCPT